jgi:hypothetical protein
LWFKDTTVGFVVHDEGWTRFYVPLKASRSESKPDPRCVSAMSGGSALSTEVWPGSSGRTQTDGIGVWHDRTIKCRHGHLLEVPSGGKLRRMMERVSGEEVLYLPGSRS